MQKYKVSKAYASLTHEILKNNENGLRIENMFTQVDIRNPDEIVVNFTVCIVDCILY